MNALLKSLLPHGLVEWAKERNKQFRAADFKKEFREHSRALSDGRFACVWNDRLPCLDDRTPDTAFDAHYLYHPAWAARILARDRPALHIDIGSSLQFVSMLSAFIPVQAYDYRPAGVGLSGLECLRGDLLALPFGSGSIESLSCMHVAEHVGLGRYGDPIDPHGDVKSFAELSRVVRPGGRLLFVVPVAEHPRIQFNAHRIYSYRMVVDSFPGCALEEFSLVLDSGEFVEDATEGHVKSQRYGCGCFSFKKRGM